MLYAIHETAYRSAAPLSIAAKLTRAFWRSPYNPAAASQFGRTLFASADLTANLTRRYFKPAWNINAVEINDRTVRVTRETAWRSPWVKLLHFRRNRDDLSADLPNVIGSITTLMAHNLR